MQAAFSRLSSALHRSTTGGSTSRTAASATDYAYATVPLEDLDFSGNSSRRRMRQSDDASEVTHDVAVVEDDDDGGLYGVSRELSTTAADTEKGGDDVEKASVQFSGAWASFFSYHAVPH